MSKETRRHTIKILLLICLAWGIAGCSTQADQHAIPGHMTPTYFPA
jgi:hypothetical protein